MNFSLEINSTVISTVVANDKAVSKLQGANSRNTDSINKTKLQTIAHLAADLADESSFPSQQKKGKLFSVRMFLPASSFNFPTLASKMQQPRNSANCHSF